LSPWSMTWGKLLGAVSFNWYGGAICLAVAIVAGIMSDEPHMIVDLPTLVTTGIMTHAALLALNMHSGQMEMRLIQRGGLGWIAIILILLISQIIINETSYTEMVNWWGVDIPLRLFVLISTLIFAIIFTFGAWRVISNALQVRTLPWSWPLFGILLGSYLAGFYKDASDHALYNISHYGLLVAAIMTYATLFSEPARLTDWNKLRLRLRRSDWRGLLQHLPLWPTTLLLSFCFALPALVPDTGIPRYSDWRSTLIGQAPLAFALMLLRDACILLFFSFSPKSKRPAATALVYIVVLDALLPILFEASGMDAVSFFFLPHTGKFGATAATLVMATHAVIGLGLVTWRLLQAEARQAAKA